MHQQQLSKMLLMYNLEKREKNIYFSIAFSISMWFQHHHTHTKQRK